MRTSFELVLVHNWHLEHEENPKAINAADAVIRIIFFIMVCFLFWLRIERAGLCIFPALNNAKYNCYKGYYQQHVNKTAGVKAEEPYGPANYKNDCNYV
jgi:hypothetical protein